MQEEAGARSESEGFLLQKLADGHKLAFKASKSYFTHQHSVLCVIVLVILL